MFDKLIESNSAGAEFKPRRTFFMVSFVVVGIAFLSALVFDLYAANFDLGTDDFELVEIVSPPSDVPEPKPPREQPQQRNQTQQSEVAVRHELVARIDDTQTVPDKISTTRFTGLTRPDGPVRIDPLGPESNSYAPSVTSGVPKGGGSAEPTTVADVTTPTEPPAAAKPVVKKPVTQSKGVVNGFAIDLPKPAYSAVARAMNLGGVVNVQVLIDESGNVVSAKAVDGHILFRQEAERAARKAKFKPTLLSDQPVKVTGVIVYNFKKA